MDAKMKMTDQTRLDALALWLWPSSLPHAEYNRREWLRAVYVVRSTKEGWRLDDAERTRRANAMAMAS